MFKRPDTSSPAPAAGSAKRSRSAPSKATSGRGGERKALTIGAVAVVVALVAANSWRSHWMVVLLGSLLLIALFLIAVFCLVSYRKVRRMSAIWRGNLYLALSVLPMLFGISGRIAAGGRTVPLVDMMFTVGIALLVASLIAYVKARRASLAAAAATRKPKPAPQRAARPVAPRVDATDVDGVKVGVDVPCPVATRRVAIAQVTPPAVTPTRPVRPPRPQPAEPAAAASPAGPRRPGRFWNRDTATAVRTDEPVAAAVSE